jgi:hypothetical protein
MATTPTTAIPKALSERELDIAQRIRGLALRIADDLDDKFTAMDAAQAASGNEQTGRMGILVEVAELSQSQQWTDTEIKLAAARAKSMAMDNRPDEDRTKKTVGVFCSEMQVPAHPSVRARFPTILAACQDAWNRENAEKAVTPISARSELDQPVHKYKSRLYQLILEVTRAVRDNKVVVVNYEDVVNWARQNDPDHDDEKIAKRIGAIIIALHEMAKDFGDEDLKLAETYLRNITPKKLRASRAAMGNTTTTVSKITPQPKVEKSTTKPVEMPTKVSATPPAPTPIQPVSDAPVASAEGENAGVVEGAYDPFDDLLNDQDDQDEDEDNNTVVEMATAA